MFSPIKIVAMLGLGLVAGYFITQSRNASPVLEHATVLPASLPLPEFTLQDQNADTFTSRNLEGQWSLMFFGFTHCPDICPITLQQLAAARRQLAETIAADDLPGIVFVSVDPARDTTATVKAYTEAFGPGITGVTGELEEINKLTGALGIYHHRHDAVDGHYAVDHSAAIVMINDRGEYHAMFSAPHSVEGLARDIQTLMGRS